MSVMKNKMVPFVSAEEIRSLVGTLAKKIEKDYANQEIVIICPLKGSCLFVADLIRRLQLSVIVDFVHLTSPKGEGVRILKDISVDVAGKHVLIAEEIVDAGRTLSFLRSRLLSGSPKSLKIVTLLDKPARRELPIKPDYIGRTIDDRFVVGYGLDSEEIGRNYSDIFNYAN
ncbi:MAG: hypoxanthine phosphoribosyltransferase [Bdellovibrionales bacterium RBG_16_40_8]|nr:MAG: hypoxanthine phosphoribosyltransferase [Bdellovibrionales bacterium RBG_16_40_8]